MLDLRDRRSASRRTFSPEFNAPWGIHVEQAGRRATCGRQTGNLSASNDKVITPSVSTRIEQCRHRPRVEIDARVVRPFVRVAAVAVEGEATGIVDATVLPRYDVFDVERNKWCRILWHTAIITRVASHAFEQTPASLVPC